MIFFFLFTFSLLKRIWWSKDEILNVCSIFKSIDEMMKVVTTLCGSSKKLDVSSTRGLIKCDALQAWFGDGGIWAVATRVGHLGQL